MGFTQTSRAQKQGRNDTLDVHNPRSMKSILHLKAVKLSLRRGTLGNNSCMDVELNP